MEKKPKKIGIVGGGQLGRYLAVAANGLGFETVVLDPTPGSPAAQVADRHMIGSFADPDSIRALSQEVDIMTFEIESADADTLIELQKEGHIIHPSPQTLLIIKDKYGQKQFLTEQSIPVAPFEIIENKEQAVAVAETFGYPFLLKTRFGAYDGRGNFTVHSEKDIDTAFETLGDSLLYAEKFVPFVKELAVVAVRAIDGTVVTYPVVETVHTNHICDTVTMPAPVSTDIAKKAERLASNVLQALEGVGVFGIEMFLTEEGDVLINEIAPRVHNSGHITMDACVASQFENHIRAITGVELGDCAMCVPAAMMKNILGDRAGNANPQGIIEAEKTNGVAAHIYGKSETRPQRKMGHINVCGDDTEQITRIINNAHTNISL